MAQWKERSKRKNTGGVYKSYRKKKARDTGKDPVYTKISSKLKSRSIRLKGGKKLQSLVSAKEANVEMKGGKIKKLLIENVVENTASRNFVRQGIITKGAVIKVANGLARVTSRPTREGIVNAILLK